MALPTLSGPRRKLILAGVSLVVTFIVGLLIGRFAISSQGNGANLSGVPRAIIQEADDTVHEKLASRIKAENIRENLRQLTSKPHLAGTPADYRQAKELADLWIQQGFDDVTITPYEVLMSYPDLARPNVVRVRGQNDEILYESPLTEAILTPRENVPGVVPPFNAYSANGTVTGDLVYVNYGRDEDFKYVTEDVNINVTGKIAIARYGKIFRGDKAKAAQKYGAIGLIIYTDPADYAMGANSSDVYPHSWWLPPTGAQRGTLFVTDGDPETPGYPSIDTAYRAPESQINLPAIPVHPISYGEAENIMKYMSGPVVTPDWSGGMNIVYRYGPGFNNQTLKHVEMRISTQNQRNVTYNTIGIITGAVEPDRYVILGNHRDAWVFGAMDPSSGTAAMMEAARVMAEMVRSGEWRPRRSLVFCSWGAEEYGDLGSFEWVEEYMKNLGARTVAYLNVDIAVSGTRSLSVGATPLLNRAVYEAAKRVVSPRGDGSLYDEWLKAVPQTVSGQSPQPRIDPPGSGSDHDPFLLKAGIPVANIGYKSESQYPLYHSVYETFYAMEKFYDPDFKIHASVTSFWVELARSLSDSLVLPYNVSDYAVLLEQSRHDLDNEYGPILKLNVANYSALDSYIKDFKRVAAEFMNSLGAVNRNNPLAVRAVNDQMMQLERTFIDPAGLPGRAYHKHVVLAPNMYNAYAASSFPGLVDLLGQLDASRDHDSQWKPIKKRISPFSFSSSIQLLRH
ncbi:N-acetylated-alpha-linked acidic dipeptidase 2-like [Haliotis rubra]|uniref:N-acetylated-alpha-linked acidic dipeptidase 2-like n=1 Tax=Haliotis rubra TaxID=36100 RepID=UPI001EE5B411|nr:N-acetylated-alpha-linked acidic dipeptidase 2-like [Haliotis rubra]